MWKRTLSLGLISFALVGCGGEGSPTGPSTTTPPATSAPPASTRTISVSGSLAFGEVPMGASREGPMVISNTGSAPLTVTSLSVTGGLASHITASWTAGSIAPGTSRSVIVRFAPTSSGSFSGSVIVNGDQTSGANSIPVSGSSVVSFAGTWTGGHVITACNGTGSVQDLICGPTRGAFKVGTSMHFSATLTQNGTSVSGTVNLGGPSGPVTGTVIGNTLTLSGTLRDNHGFTSTITSWTTTVAGSTKTGDVGYSLTYSGLPGNAGIVARLTNVTKR